MDCKINELMWWLKIITLILSQINLERTYGVKNEVFHYNYKILNEIIEKEKVYQDKRGLSYLSKFKTFITGKTTFMKLKERSFFQGIFFKQVSKCIIDNKSGHVDDKCFSKLFEKYQSLVTRLVRESNYIQNQNLNIKKVVDLTLGLRKEKFKL